MKKFQLFINFPFICSLLKLEPTEYFRDYKIMMEAQIETYRKLELPVCLSPDLGLVTECSAFGADVHYDPKGFPGIKGKLVNSMQEAAQLKIPDPHTDGLMVNVLEALEYMKSHAPADAVVEVTPVSAPFNTAAMLRGIGEFCEDLFDEDEEEYVTAFLELVTDATIAYVQAQEEIVGKADKILIADDVSAFVNRQMFSQFVRPTYDRLYQAFPHAARWLHNDASAKHIAGLIADAGFDAWHIGSCLDMGETLEETQGKLKLIGNLDPAIFRTGTAADVAEATKAQLALYGENPAYVASLGGFINYGTPLENVLEFISCAK